LRQQANNVTHRQRVPADQVSWGTPGATLRRGRFCHLASQDQRTLEEECYKAKAKVKHHWLKQ